jgi:hypothetical protein
VQLETDGLELAAQRTKLQALRDELSKLQRNVPPSDIDEQIDTLVAALAPQALPEVRFQGGTLQVTFQGDPYNNNRNPGLLLMAGIDPTGLSALIRKAVMKVQPLSASEHAGRCRELEQAIDELSYVVAALLAEAGAPPDPLMAPWHLVGVRVESFVQEGAAA